MSTVEAVATEADPVVSDVVIIGAGFAGVGAAIRLQQRGINDIVILERDVRPGGTWRDNTYPGAACDIPSRLYSYSFAPNPDWSRTYSGSSEILGYIDAMVADHDLDRLIRYGSNVTGLTFEEECGRWAIAVSGGLCYARTVVVASGPLSTPGFPDIPGIDDFAGKRIHSAAWDHDYDFAGKRVAVIGTGASAVQIIPQIVKKAKAVKVFQRTPGWVLPRMDRRVAERTQKMYRTVPLTQMLARKAWFYGHESMALAIVWDTPLTRLVSWISKAHLRQQVSDPWLRRQLTPDFRPGCKRLLMSSDYYPALQEDNCTLVTWPIAKITEAGIRTAEGIEHQVDCIVFATGFEVSKQGSPIPIFGRDGRELAPEWCKGAYAYKSYAVSGYPNLYLTFGPNSGPGHNSALVYMEEQIEAIALTIDTILKQDLQLLDVRRDVQDRLNEDLQRRLTKTTWNSGCRSWYLTDEGFNATMFPGFASQFAQQMRSVDLTADFTAVAAKPPVRAPN